MLAQLDSKRRLSVDGIGDGAVAGNRNSQETKCAELSERTKRGAAKSEKQKLGTAGASLLGVL